MRKVQEIQSEKTLSFILVIHAFAEGFLQLRSTGFEHMDSAAVVHGLSYSAACGIHSPTRDGIGAPVLEGRFSIPGTPVKSPVKKTLGFSL